MVVLADFVDAGDFEAVALRGELEERVEGVRVAAGLEIQAHGKAAPGWVTLSASRFAMLRGGAPRLARRF
jgi:hypothetical protein